MSLPPFFCPGQIQWLLPFEIGAGLDTHSADNELFLAAIISRHCYIQAVFVFSLADVMNTDAL